MNRILDNIAGKMWKAVATIILLLGAYATIVRFTQGLGASTNLSDEFPWGLWIGFDILVGVGLAAGGFVIAATVHLFGMHRYEDVARPTILTAFLGYVLVIFALLFDLGRPYRIWHPMVMGNPHSVMFEVAMCVMLYTTVLAAEFSPLVFARLGWTKAVKAVKTVYIPLVILGVLLSTLHQSSLGTMYVIVPDKLHGLWYTPLLPVFFFLSAVAAGLAMTIFESFVSGRAFGRRLESDLLEGMARVIVVVLAVLLVFKLQDLASRGNFGLIFQPTPEAVMFWGEMALGVILPMVLFATERGRTSEAGLFFGALMTITGFVMNRLNVAITGMAGASGVNYIPSWMEFAVTASIVVVGFILFGLAVKHLNVFPEHEGAMAALASPSTAPARFYGRPIAALWALLAVGAILLGFTTKAGTKQADELAALTKAEPFSPTRYARLLDRMDHIPIKMGEDSPGPVYFNHSDHVYLDEPECGSCHPAPFKVTEEGREAQPYMLMDEIYDGKYCGKCHNGDDAFASDDDCEACHAE